MSDIKFVKKMFQAAIKHSKNYDLNSFSIYDYRKMLNPNNKKHLAKVIENKFKRILFANYIRLVPHHIFQERIVIFTELAYADLRNRHNLLISILGTLGGTILGVVLTLLLSL